MPHRLRLYLVGERLPNSRSEMTRFLGVRGGTGPEDPVPIELLDAIAAREGAHKLSDLADQTGTDEDTAGRILDHLGGSYALLAMRDEERYFTMDRRMRRHMLALADDTKPGEKRLDSV